MFNWLKKSKVEEKSLSSPESWLLDLFGSTPTNAGVSVTADSALRVPAVNSAIRLISEAVATLDIQIVSVGEDGSKKQVPSHPIAGLLEDPNDYTSGYELIRDLVIDALTYDAGGFGWVNRVGGIPREIILPTRGTLSVEYNPVTREPSYRMQGNPLNSADVIHLRSPFGRSPLSLAREAIGEAIVMQKHNAKLFSTGARPSGALSFPKTVSEEGIKKMRAAWFNTHDGADNAGKTAVLVDGAEFTPFQLTSVDSQFIESRKFVLEEIARAFRVPSSMIGLLDRATWSNMESLGKEFLSYTLEPWLRSVEAALNRSLFNPEERGIYRVHLERDDISRADLQTRATAINSLIASRVLNPNEGRSWLDLGPYAGGETYANPNTGSNQPGGNNATE